jgi:hypothetical protein
VGHAGRGRRRRWAEHDDQRRAEEFKAELVRNKGPWKGIDDLEVAVAEYVDWFNHRRLHGELGLIPPLEYEANHSRHNLAPTIVGASVPSLHGTRRGTVALPQRGGHSAGF